MSEVKPLEVWGGLECSRVRIADEIRDQIVDTGHRDRPEDIGPDRRPRDKSASLSGSLGDSVQGCRRARLELARLAARAITISQIFRRSSDLLHHGSGPSYCDVLDPAFPQSLARYAA